MQMNFASLRAIALDVVALRHRDSIGIFWR
jgi:hypothetical protein